MHCASLGIPAGLRERGNDQPPAHFPQEGGTGKVRPSLTPPRGTTGPGTQLRSAEPRGPAPAHRATRGPRPEGSRAASPLRAPTAGLAAPPSPPAPGALGSPATPSLPALPWREGGRRLRRLRGGAGRLGGTRLSSAGPGPPRLGGAGGKWGRPAVLAAPPSAPGPHGGGGRCPARVPRGKPGRTEQPSPAQPSPALPGPALPRPLLAAPPGGSRLDSAVRRSQVFRQNCLSFLALFSDSTSSIMCKVANYFHGILFCYIVPLEKAALKST